MSSSSCSYTASPPTSRRRGRSRAPAHLLPTYDIHQSPVYSVRGRFPVDKDAGFHEKHEKRGGGRGREREREKGESEACVTRRVSCSRAQSSEGISVASRNRDRVRAAHMTMHLDLPFSPSLPRRYRCVSRFPPPASPLLVRARPPAPAGGREACWRCRRRILTTS